MRLPLAITRGMATRIAPKVKDRIDLSDAEDSLCSLLDEFTSHLKNEHDIVTACRINGGWVRDKVNPVVIARRTAYAQRTCTATQL